MPELNVTIPNLDLVPYSEDLRRLLYDAVARIVLAPAPGEPGPDAGDLAVYYAWGRWFAVWRELGEDAGMLPLSQVWQVARVSWDPHMPDGIMLHEV
ncbi:MAG: hypothetical protein ACJ76J_28625 [Thermoanaerobaculia bacterium]